jgi:tetratricopeptide (TPR) repeat protein
MARYFLALGVFLSSLLLSSCGESEVYVRVLEGNYAFSRGDYMSANFDYIRASRFGVFLPRIHYNTGNVYHALGESEAALMLWLEAEDPEDEELFYRIYFNRGVLHYEQGEYEEAYTSFRRALKFRPADREAKVNLEYSLRKQAIEEGGEPPVSDSQEQDSIDDDGRRILEYVQRSDPVPTDFASEEMEEGEVKDW